MSSSDTSTSQNASSDPKQNFGTDGIAPMERPGAVTRFFMGIVAWAERLNLKYAKLGNPPVYDNATFPWVAEVERPIQPFAPSLKRFCSDRANCRPSRIFHQT